MKIKEIIFFLAGIGIGGASGYFFARKKLDKAYDEMLDTEINELREYYDKKIEEICSKCGVQTIILEDSDVKKTGIEGKSAQNEPKNEEKREKRTAYNSYFRPDETEFDTDLVDLEDQNDPGGPTDDDPEEEEFEISDEDDVVIKHMSRTGIELISSLDYNERNGYDKEELFYYRKTKSLADSNDELVDGFIDVVGGDFQDIVEQGNQGTIYIRNHGFAKDYLITVLNERYDFSRI